MQLYLVDTESTPPYPRGSVKPRRLRDLAWMQDFQECRVHDHGFGLSHQFGHDGASQGFDEPPEPAYPPVKRGGVQTDHAGEQLREKTGAIAQERTLRLYAPKLLEERERDDLRIREALYRLVASGARVEGGVSIVYEAEEHGHGLFQAV